ncbi:hypothetical protein SAMN04488498_12953 [Mesorhizobium albiziae]|uniref:Uncharacterized protein n=1 Tax=Neomesorhizobium albiziae TaxID=335020 RepID=A0A1I4EQU0_9HYPH|nr:hypothetical protein SAMN04488498_12953 [Mesorhizobium albiziae]
MPQLHARGVDLVVELLKAADHLEHLTSAESKALLKEAAMVLGELLKRDIPEELRDGGDLQAALDRPAALSKIYSRRLSSTVCWRAGNTLTVVGAIHWEKGQRTS